MRSLNKLSALAVKNAGPGKHFDGGGLFLRVGANGSGRWVLRFSLHGNQREMGLGSRETLSLAAVRQEAAKCRDMIAAGVDPIREREQEARAAVMQRPSLSVVAEQCFEARKPSLKGDGAAGRWFSPIKLHILPRLGKTPIEDIHQNDIRDALSPIWQKKAETARKALTRLGLVMKHGAAMGLDVDLQATMKAKELLGAQNDKIKHIEAMPWPEVSAFCASLAGRGAVSECLLFIILTAGARSAPARHARWEDIDLNAQVCTVPGEDMKGKRGKTPDFRVPLSGMAMEVLRRVRPLERDGLVFTSPRKGCVSDTATIMLMRRRDLEYRPHGFRSSFRG